MSFRNDIIELSAVGVFDLIENRNNYMKRPDFVPYVFAGVAVFRHNPKGLVGPASNFFLLLLHRISNLSRPYLISDVRLYILVSG